MCVGLRKGNGGERIYIEEWGRGDKNRGKACGRGDGRNSKGAAVRIII